MKTDLKPINTVFSVHSVLDIKELTDAKILMNEKYGNQYSFIPPHLSYTIMPFPETNLGRGVEALTQYVNKQRSFNIQISSLKYEDKNKFFYVDIEGDMIIKHHENITKLLNEFRDNHVREKDLLRLENGDFDEISSNYIEDFGYARVFDNFKTHVTVGNFTVDNVDIEKLTKDLLSILEPVLNKKIVIDNIEGVFHTDSNNNQSEMKRIWDKVYILKQGYLSGGDPEIESEPYISRTL